MLPEHSATGRWCHTDGTSQSILRGEHVGSEG
uniref:Uncharacterized protein n=1 Tax=Arundo donax TaxID=35708 RepID=A0A0A9F7H8_ARUDO